MDFCEIYYMTTGCEAVQSMRKQSVEKTKRGVILLVPLIFITLISFFPVDAVGQTANNSSFFLGMLVVESEHQAVLSGIQKIKDLQLGNLVVIPAAQEDWNLTLIEESIEKANDLGLYAIVETYDYEPYEDTTNEMKITPSQFAAWKSKYPLLLGILVSEIGGKQIDFRFWEENSTGTVKYRYQAEQAVIGSIISKMQLEDFKNEGAKIFLQENVISYASANTSYCDVFVSKVFNAPNVELMIGLARGMVSPYNIPEWGFWVDTWRGMIEPPAFTPNDVERALYEAWFYGARYFFFEQGCFFGTFAGDWPNEYIILGLDGKLTDYGKVLQKFYAFLRNGEIIGYSQPNYNSSIAVMIGQSGWGGRGTDWGFWNQSERQGDFDYRLLNFFFPGIGDNWGLARAEVTKDFTGLVYGMVDVISIYAPSSVMKRYKVIVALGWSLMNDAITNNIRDYVQGGGIFVSFLTFTHTNETTDDLENPYAWTQSPASLFGYHVATPTEGTSDIRADTFLHNITFTQNTFWHPWSGKVYNYLEPAENMYWFWKFKYRIYPSEYTKVLAWVDGNQSWPNAFIVENRNGTGYTYVINTRNPNSLPNGVFTDVIADFINNLCSHYVKPTLSLTYPQYACWLSHGQADRAIYLTHDNSSTTHTFSYNISASTANFDPEKEYVVFDWFNKEFYGVKKGPLVPINVTLQPNAGKLFLMLELSQYEEWILGKARKDEPMGYLEQLMRFVGGISPWTWLYVLFFLSSIGTLLIIAVVAKHHQKRGEKPENKKTNIRIDK